MRNLFATALAALALAALAPAQDPASDTITLKNGDRITGTIASITASEIVITTAATDEIKVALDQVANVTTSAPLKLVTDDGERIEAPVQGLSDGKLRVGTGAAVRELPAGALVIYREPVEWTGSFNIGAALSTGNTERRSANAQAQAVRRTDETRLTMRATWDYGEQKTRGDFDNDPSTPDQIGPWELAQRRTFGAAKFDYFLTDDLYAWAQGSAENDKLSDLELRLAGSAGLGYLLIEEATFALQGEAGVGYIDENRYTAGADSAYATARLAYNLRWDITDETQFLQDGEFYPSLEDKDDIYARIDSRLRTTLTDSMFGQLQYVFDYDNTPSPGFLRDDHRLIASVGWSF